MNTANNIEAATSAVFFQSLSRKTEARNDPAKRHAVNERMPEQASATPTWLGLPSASGGSTRMLPCCSIGMPSRSKQKNTTEVTLRSRKRLRFCSTTETIGADTSQTRVGKTKSETNFTRASSKMPTAEPGRVAPPTASGALRNIRGNNNAAEPRVRASVPGRDGPAPAR